METVLLAAAEQFVQHELRRQRAPYEIAPYVRCKGSDIQHLRVSRGEHDDHALQQGTRKDCSLSSCASYVLSSDTNREHTVKNRRAVLLLEALPCNSQLFSSLRKDASVPPIHTLGFTTYGAIINRNFLLFSEAFTTQSFKRFSESTKIRRLIIISQLWKFWLLLP